MEKGKKVVLIRSNAVTPDPPVEKMANTLLGLSYSIVILGWDRNLNYNEKKEYVQLNNGKVEIVRFGIKASFGAGFRGNLKPLFEFQSRVKKWLDRHENDISVIHAFDFDTGFISALFVKRKETVKFVYHMLDYYADSHNLGKGVFRKIICKLEARVVSQSHATVICTEKRKKQIIGCKPNKLYIIHNTPNPQNINTEISLIKSTNDNRMKIVYVGILVNSRMLREIAEIVAKDNRYEFHIGGFGVLENYFDNLSKKYSNIFYYGKIPYASTLALENEGDIMVAIYNPTIRNNQFSAPNKFYEALMIGKPLMMAKGTGFDDIILKEKIGIVVDFSVEGIKWGLEQLWKQKNKWSDICRNEKELYKKEYSWNIMEERIKQMYNNL